MKIDKYEDKIFLRFEERGDSWGNISKLPHYKVWIKVLNYLKKRGFKVETPQYYIEQYPSKANNKTAIKSSNGVAFCLECMGNQIKIEFGNSKNIWKDWGCNFWSEGDHRAEILSYLEKKAIQNEVRQFLKVFGEFQEHDIKRTVEDRIIHNKKESRHSYNKEKLDELGLGGVVFQMSEHDHSQNSFDRDKLKLVCGEERYYYKGKTLCKGVLYHQLNDRWFVISGGTLDYVSSWELFNYGGESRRKKLTKEEKINRLESELRKYEKSKNYVRCISINKQVVKIKASENTYNVWSIKHNSWWRANNSGYCDDRSGAGVYLESNILANKSYYNDGTTNKAVLIE